MLVLLVMVLVMAAVLYITNHPLLSVLLLASTILILVLGTAIGVAHSALVL